MEINLKTTVIISVALASGLIAGADPVVLQEGTATFSQSISASFSPDQVHDGDLGDLNGWAILRSVASSPTSTLDEAAVWETASDLPQGRIVFTMRSLHFTNTQHMVGRFRWSVTADDRSTFADGLDNGGDVDASWTVLQNAAVVVPAGMIFQALPDGSILTSGDVPNTGAYQVAYQLPFSGTTGIRLEVMEDASLPQNGPGHHSGNGNFHLTELNVEIRGPVVVPLDSTVGRIDVSGATLQLFWDAQTCNAGLEHHLLFGWSDQLPSSPGGLFTLEGSDCDLGTGSPYTWSNVPDPTVHPSRFLWWVIVARDGAGTESSWGEGSAGLERNGGGPDGSSGECGSVQKDDTEDCIQ